MFQGPLFIVGAPRSGTSLLRDLLRQHPRIGLAPYETDFLPVLTRKQTQWGDLSEWQNFERFYQWALRFQYFKHFETEGGKIIEGEKWHAACERHDAAGIFEALVRHDGGSPLGSERIWGDKTPPYRLHLPLLKQLFPDSRFIHIIRDVRDVCLSSHSAWGKSMVRTAQIWADETPICQEAGREMKPEDYLELRYEDLTGAPETWLRRVSDFLEVPFDPATLELARPAEKLGTANASTQVLSSNREKWRKKMTEATQQQVEAIAGSLLVELGYPTLHDSTPRRLTALEWKLLQVNDGIQLLRFRQKEWGIVEAIRRTISAYESRA